MRKMILVLTAALFCAACAADTPTRPSAPLPAKGSPFRLELNAAVPTGANGGTANITARVMDAFGNAVAGFPVDFTATSGTFSEATATTSDKGIATTILTAQPGTVTITAKAASLQTQTIVSVQPQVVPPTPGPNPGPAPLPPGPNPLPPSPGLFSVSVSANAVQVGATTTFVANVGGATPPLRASWDFGDGATFSGSTLGNQPTATHAYQTTGTFHTTVVVQDAAGHSASAATDAVVSAVPLPTPSYTVTISATPSSVTVNNTATLTATAAQINGAPAPTNFAWDCDGNGTVDQNTAANSAVCTYSTVGTTTSKVTVTGGSATGTGTTTVTVTAPLAPSYTVSLTASQPSVLIGEAAVLVASVTRLNGAPVPTDFAWDCNNNLTIVHTSTNVESCTYSTAGTVASKVTVTDVLGGTISASASTTVTVAPTPTFVVAVAASSPNVATGSTVKFTATLSSSGPTLPTNLKWEWDDQADGTIDFIRTTAVGTTDLRDVVVVTALPTAIWKATVKVTDISTGRTATGTGQVSVHNP